MNDLTVPEKLRDNASAVKCPRKPSSLIRYLDFGVLFVVKQTKPKIYNQNLMQNPVNNSRVVD